MKTEAADPEMRINVVRQRQAGAESEEPTDVTWIGVSEMRWRQLTMRAGLGSKRRGTHDHVRLSAIWAYAYNFGYHSRSVT